MSEIVQQASNLSAEMLKSFQNLTQDEQASRPALVEAMRVLADLHSNIMPVQNLDGEAKLTLAEIKEWSQRLQVALGQTQVLRLYWIADVLSLSM